MRRRTLRALAGTFKLHHRPHPQPAGRHPRSTTLDNKRPWLSYVANEIIMPPEYGAAKDETSPPGTGNLCLVTADEIESAQHTILLAEFSNSRIHICAGGPAYSTGEAAVVDTPAARPGDRDPAGR